MLEKSSREGWVILAGFGDVLEWFAERQQPAFPIFGRRKGHYLAGAGTEEISAHKKQSEHLLIRGTDALFCERGSAEYPPHSRAASKTCLWHLLRMEISQATTTSQMRKRASMDFI